jgi:asparagine synthase (glutamine-hydrolysing)
MQIKSVTTDRFVGYWGYGEFTELKTLLSQCLASANVQQHQGKIHSDSRADSGVWAIASPCLPISLSPHPSLCENFSQDAIAVSISACGRNRIPGDAWVKIADGQLVLGRDPFGRVPLYWMQIGDAIWFASTLQFLLPLVPSPQVSISALYTYTCFSYVPTPLTPVEEIAAISAGTELTWQIPPTPLDRGGVIPPFIRGVRGDLNDWCESVELIRDETLAATQLQTLLKNAIGRQIEDLPSDEPVGVFLSGGIDSSVVAALLVQAGLKVRAYALDFGVDAYSELPYAQQVADDLHIPLVRVPATAKQIVGAIASTAKALDLPYGDGVTAPLYLLNQAATRETRVVFNGENGDQLFAGWTNKPLIASGIYNRDPDGIESFNQQYLRTFGRFYGYEEKIFTPTICDRIKSLDLQTYLHSALDPELCPALLMRLRRASLMLKGAQNIQPRATSLAFANNLWVRSPFCDPELTRWTFRLPGELVLQGACEKYILKRAVEAWLPPEIVWREKRGMGVPLKPWYYKEMWADLGNWLNPGVLRAEGHFTPQIAWQMMSGQMGVGMRDRYLGNNLWLLIMWQAWRIHVLGESAIGRSADHPFWISPKLWFGWRRLRDP